MSNDYCNVSTSSGTEDVLRSSLYATYRSVDPDPFILRILNNPLFAFAHIAPAAESIELEQLDWYDAEGLALVFAQIEEEEIALANMGMADFAETLNIIDNDEG